MLFPAPRAPEAPPPEGYVAIWLDVAEARGRVEAWLRTPESTSTGHPAPLIVFAHGNGELIDYWVELGEVFAQWGWATLLLEYPGYGRSGGEPSEKSVRATARAAYDWAVEQPGVDRGRVVAYGRSLGAAALAQLARDRRIDALILESTFTSVTAMARRMGVPAALVSDPFDTLSVVERFEGPVLVLHGDRDEIVPVEHGETLADAAGVELVRMPCGHNDCPRPWPEIEAFLAGLTSR